MLCAVGAQMTYQAASGLDLVTGAEIMQKAPAEAGAFALSVYSPNAAGFSRTMRSHKALSASVAVSRSRRRAISVSASDG